MRTRVLSCFACFFLVVIFGFFVISWKCDMFTDKKLDLRVSYRYCVEKLQKSYMYIKKKEAYACPSLIFMGKSVTGMDFYGKKCDRNGFLWRESLIGQLTSVKKA